MTSLKQIGQLITVWEHLPWQTIAKKLVCGYSKFFNLLLYQHNSLTNTVTVQYVEQSVAADQITQNGNKAYFCLVKNISPTYIIGFSGA